MLQAPTTEAVEAAATRVFAAPIFDWTPPSELESWASRFATRVMRWLTEVQGAHPWVFRAVLIVIVATLLAATMQAAWSAWQQYREQRLPEAARLRRRVTRLAREDAEELATLAERLASEGRYAEAMQCLWAAFDASLRETGVLQAGRTLTPRELARELGPALRGSLPLATLVTQLYAVAYRGDAATDADWQRWRDGVRSAWPSEERRPRAA